MKSTRTREFRSHFDQLPAQVQAQAVKAYALFRRNPDHPSLNFKPVRVHPGWYAARISLNYRALCTKVGDSYVWFWIGPHTEYDKMIK